MRPVLLSQRWVRGHYNQSGSADPGYNQHHIRSCGKRSQNGVVPRDAVTARTGNNHRIRLTGADIRCVAEAYFGIRTGFARAASPVQPLARQFLHPRRPTHGEALRNGDFSRTVDRARFIGSPSSTGRECGKEMSLTFIPYPTHRPFTTPFSLIISKFSRKKAEQARGRPRLFPHNEQGRTVRKRCNLPQLTRGRGSLKSKRLVLSWSRSGRPRGTAVGFAGTDDRWSRRQRRSAPARGHDHTAANREAGIAEVAARGRLILYAIGFRRSFSSRSLSVRRSESKALCALAVLTDVLLVIDPHCPLRRFHPPR